MTPFGTPQALNAAQAREASEVSRLLQAGRAREALPAARRLVAKAANAPDAHHLLALCHAEACEPEDAEHAFKRALELAPGHPMILVNYAVMLRKTGRLDAALAVLRQATETSPGLAKAWSELGLVALNAGHHGQAIAALQRAVDLQPDLAGSWHALGSAAREAGDLELAETALKRVLALEPGQRSASINLGAVLRLSGRPAEAIASFQGIRSRGDASPEVADSLVGALLDEGRLEEALQLARQVVGKSPEFVAGRVTLANLLWEYGPAAGPADDPFELFRDALALQPDHHTLRAAYIQFLLSARKAADALEQIRDLRARADDPMLAWLQADALEILGRREESGALYEQLHRAWGNTVPAFLNAHARHLLSCGKWDAAAAAAMQATTLEPGNQEAWAYLATAWRVLGDPREHWLCDYKRLVGLVEVETPPGFAGQAEFLSALAANLDLRHKARRAPVQQSLRGGSQTPGRLFGRPDPLLASTRAALLDAVERWLATLPTDPAHPFLERKTRRVRMGGSWSVKLWSSGNHVNHIHSEGWISSAFYVALPPSLGSASPAGEAGCIQFGQPPAELQLGLPPRRVIRPEPGKLALFPSYMWHGTVPFEDAQPRMTVAFDMRPLADAR